MLGCAEGVAPPRQFDKAPNATADATEEKAATLVQAPEEQEQEEDPTPAPANNFNYDEWTAPLPTSGKPKIPCAPFPYLEDKGRKGTFDRMRRLRCALWEYERYNAVRREWVRNWVGGGHLVGSWLHIGDDITKICSYDRPPFRLRVNDGDLMHMKSEYEDIISKLEELTGVRHYESDSARHTLYSFFHGETLRPEFQSNNILRDWNKNLTDMWEDLKHDHSEIYLNEERADVNNILHLINQAACRNYSRIVNSCWYPVLHRTITNLKSPRCADQR